MAVKIFGQFSSSPREKDFALVKRPTLERFGVFFFFCARGRKNLAISDIGELKYQGLPFQSRSLQFYKIEKCWLTISSIHLVVQITFNL